MILLFQDYLHLVQVSKWVYLNSLLHKTRSHQPRNVQDPQETINHLLPQRSGLREWTLIKKDHFQYYPGVVMEPFALSVKDVEKVNQIHGKISTSIHARSHSR